MRICIIGSGAREHAIARSLARDPDVSHIVVAPGNPGIAGIAELAGVDALDPDAVAALATDVHADLVVIGPEAPLVAGVADAVRAVGIPVFGPEAAAARLEGSKAFAKEIMAAADVPTARAHVATTVAEAAEALDAFGAPYVVKDDGLAAGKGVVVTHDRDVALAHAEACLAKGAAHAVVIEEYLDGPEVSLFFLCDGTVAVPLSPAQDFKRLGDGDAGPNTGGMGAYSPLPWAPPDLVEEVTTRIARPVLAELRHRGISFVGVLYVGLALTSRGVRVVEFNARFGDPETQVVLARLRTPLGGLLHAAATGALADVPDLRWSPEAAVTVVLAAAGYPESPRRGDEITGIEDAEAIEGVHVLHAGTVYGEATVPDGDMVPDGGARGNGTTAAAGGTLRSAGGRVLSVVGTGADLDAARAAVYSGVQRITLPGVQFRSDIAQAAAAGATSPPPVG